MTKAFRCASWRLRIATALLSPWVLISCSGDLRHPATPLPTAAAPLAVPAAAIPSSVPQSGGGSAGVLPPDTEITRGSGSVINGSLHRHKMPATKEGDITLDFVNMDVRDVVKAVLGDLLKLNYIVDAKVEGNVTIQTSRPLPREGVLSVFEQVLKMNGIAIVRSGDLYQVVTTSDAPRQTGLMVRRAAGQPGYGVEVVPLQYVGAAEMRQLLEPLVPAGSILHVDATRNLLIIGGTEQERELILEDVGMFDADWMAGMSFAFFRPNFVDAKQLAKELDQLVLGRGSPLNGIVRLVTIERLNTVLGISTQPKYLDELQTWVERLDRPGESLDKRIYVYRVQNGRAADIAGVLTKALNLGASAQSSENRGDGVSGGQEAPRGHQPSDPQSQAPTSTSADHGPAAAPASTDGGGIKLESVTGVSITADEVNNALVIVSTPREFAVIEAALHQLDVVPLQVFLDAAVAEVTLNDDLKYGIQYYFQSPGGTHQAALSTTATSAITPPFPGLAYIFTRGNDIKAILNALDSITNVKVVSSPKIMVLNNQTATLQVGDQVPIATQQATSVVTPGAPMVNSIQMRDTGVILKVTPRVNQGGMVMLDISQEVSDVSTTTTSNLDSPTIEERKLASTVAVQDGETIALGGLIKDSKTDSNDGIPFLQDVPYLGVLFRSTENNDVRTELLILITPHVIEGVQKGREITEELRRELPAARSLIPEK